MTGWSCQLTEPESAASSPIAIRIVVDLPAPFAPDEAHQLARPDPQRDPVERLRRPERLAEFADGQHGFTVLTGSGRFPFLALATGGVLNLKLALG